MDAWLKVHHDSPRDGKRLVEALYSHLNAGGMGTIGEIFDAESPYRPRGCIAQAWSVAELLRVTALLREPAGPAGAALGARSGGGRLIANEAFDHLGHRRALTTRKRFTDTTCPPTVIVFRSRSGAHCVQTKTIKNAGKDFAS